MLAICLCMKMAWLLLLHLVNQLSHQVLPAVDGAACNLLHKSINNSLDIVNYVPFCHKSSFNLKVFLGLTTQSDVQFVVT